jgi:hypothetical protein
MLLLVWFGFAACLGLLIAGQVARSGFQKRMAQTVRPTDDDAQEIVNEKHDDEMSKGLLQRLLQPIW